MGTIRDNRCRPRRPHPRGLLLRARPVRLLSNQKLIMGIRSLLSKRQTGQSDGRGHASKLVVRNQTRKVTVADSAQVADTSSTRRKGLLGRRTLEPGEGLWISPCESVHTCGMKFPIDLIYLDHRKKVRKIRASVVPWRFSMCLLAHSVLEVPAGTIDRTQTKAGDQFELIPANIIRTAASASRHNVSDTLPLEV